MNEETAPFDPLASLTEDQLLAKDQLQALALEYTQDDREKAWLSTQIDLFAVTKGARFFCVRFLLPSSRKSSLTGSFPLKSYYS